MGEVYLADDTGLRRRVALKRIVPALRNNIASREHLWKEAEWASRLNDPHIAAVYDVIEDGAEIFIVMEYVEGETLRHRLARPVTISDFLSIAAQCAEALAAAHQAGLLHRDIKPENFMLTSTGQVKALDFGVARQLPGAGFATTRETLQSASFSGTVPYMAPEVLDQKDADARADIFALGVLFYEALAGSNPFRRAGFVETCNAILHEDPPPLRNRNAAVPEELARIVTKTLEKNRDERYASAADLAVDLRALARPKQPVQPPSRLSRSKAVASFGLALLAIAIVVGVAATNTSIKQRVRTWIGGTPVPQQKQLAVLQFHATGGDAEAASFADGLTDTLTAKLTQLTDDRSLQVISATEVQAKDVTTPERAYSEFGVNLVLEGNLRKSGNLIRVNYALVDPRTHRQLTANSVTLPASDSFAVEDQVVNGVVQMLDIEVSPDARRLLDSHGTQVPDAYNLYLQGRGYLRNYDRPENIDSAIHVFQEALHLDPGYALAFAGLGDAYWKKYLDDQNPQWVQKSRESCEQSLQLDRGLAAAHECLGTLFAGTGQYENAVAEFERAVKAEPTNDDAYRGLAIAYERLGKLSDAETTYRRAIDLRPNYWAGYNWLGAFYQNHSRYSEAAAMFEKVISLVPDSFRGYYNLGAASVAEGKYAEAIASLRHSIAIRPTATAYGNLGTAYFYLRRFDESAKAFEESLKLDEKAYDAWWDLGDAYYWGAGTKTQAAAAYTQCISLANDQLRVDPRDILAVGLRALCYAMVNNRKAALADLHTGFGLPAQDPEFYFNASLVYNHFNDTDQTLRWLEKAVDFGYSPSLARDTPVFDPLRTNPRFQKLFQAK